MGSTHRLGHFSLVSARIQLARGNTAAATRDAAAAMTANGISMVQASAGGAHWAGVQGDQALECLRVAARVALAEGDVRHARELVARAASEQGTSRAKAELVILRACTARASGEPFRALAEQALSAARETDDEEFMREAHLLVVGAAQLEGDDASVKLHVDAAIQLREQVVSGLPDAIRLRYLARRDLQELARLERTLPKEASSPPASSASGVALLRAPRRSGDRRIIGDDAAIRALLVAVNKVGRSDATVLIHGESGTGKELVAEALHAASARATGPLVKLNCAALVETLLLSELFGHEKGAFTGASSRRRGRFESADGGTLFLDEIGDISPRTQVALLRVLQEKTFERVGGAASIRADVRVVCATHRDLKALVASGAFREDLYYRLCGVTLQVPALRQRPGDLGALAAALLERIAVERGERVKRLADSALRGLRTHSWPGNVRELENALRAASLFSESDELVLEDFCEHVDSLRHLADDARSRSAPHLVPPPAPTPPPTQRSVDEAASASPVEVAYAHVRGGVSLGDLKKQIERDCISRALHETDGNITRAAVLLGMKRPRLSQLVKQLGLAADGENGWPETDATELCEED
jgi:transcriptional regulator with GAF, ATPase, and Fis domain